MAIVLALLLHIFFFGIIAPRLELETAPPARTEVVEISPRELQQLKDKIMEKQRKAEKMALAENEILPQFKTKEPPKEAHMAGPHNQSVPEEQVAGPQNEASKTGGGGARAKQQQRHKNLDLSKLGLGTKLAKPTPPSPEEAESHESTDRQGPMGPSGIFRPRGLENKNIKHGTQNILNAVESPYYSFWARLFKPIEENWYFLYKQVQREIGDELVALKARPGSHYAVTMEITIDHQGNMVSVRVLEQSGLPTFDRMTRQAIEKVGAVPNPPPGIFEGRQYYAQTMTFGLFYQDSAIFDSGGGGF